MKASSVSLASAAHPLGLENPRWLCCHPPQDAVLNSPCLKPNPLSAKECTRCTHKKCEHCPILHDLKADGGYEEGRKVDGSGVGLMGALKRFAGFPKPGLPSIMSVESRAALLAIAITLAVLIPFAIVVFLYRYVKVVSGAPAPGGGQAAPSQEPPAATDPGAGP
ncbi:hypothetical protein MBM_02041 [Drepanopeziza brunnea f. sp. 'multigermtubi' MB_m1]|uniref:Uncharacterized protein n=1 Tax=Marssonina brunnea f. sp. multigermtubi (strain MB_m1) TaxID=1072389 RepID=K1Y4K8_MARBU|nr:uncharacterized protein MBM_02041 [Drepanopeziza brunnea f. sp. 'multigermtubi' MB_m1]EKD20089.1 hypothetical protein MBM_02041 [Drepanopeziza brunnea f. sp. 'multigermtubi' MB_m1]